MKEVDKRREILELLPSRFCLEIIIAAVHDVNGENVTVLEDLVEIDSFILDLEGVRNKKGGHGWGLIPREAQRSYAQLAMEKIMAEDYRWSESL